MKAKSFEQQFDKGVDITATLDLSKATRVQQEQKRVNVDFPTWFAKPAKDGPPNKLRPPTQTNS